MNIPPLYCVWNSTENRIWTLPVVRREVAEEHLRESEKANPSSRFRIVTLVEKEDRAL